MQFKDDIEEYLKDKDKHDELYIDGWSFRRMRGTNVVYAFNNETKCASSGKLIKYLDGGIDYEMFSGTKIHLRPKKQIDECDDIGILI